jgi:hypothetical protein
MAARWCALCGGEYVPGVLECADCLVPLVDDRPLAPDEVGTDEEPQTAYDLDELEPKDRFDLDRRLAARRVAHAWDGDTLIIREADEAVTDPIIDEVSDAAGLGEDDTVGAYDLHDWSEEKRDQLTAALESADIPFDWDDETNDLLVNSDDEERVESIIDAIEFPDQLPIDEGEEQAAAAGVGEAGGDGLAAQEAMSELFVAADRLMHDPEDHEGVLAAVDAARWAEALPLPFGFMPAVWKDLVGQAKQLRQALEGDAEDDEIIDRATNLRNLLRQYV